MNSQGTEATPPPDWREAEDELLDRAREVAQRIVDRVRKLTGDTAPNPALKPDEPTGEAPPIK
jgi:hypothetical protein